MKLVNKVSKGFFNPQVVTRAFSQATSHFEAKEWVDHVAHKANNIINSINLTRSPNPHERRSVVENIRRADRLIRYGLNLMPNYTALLMVQNALTFTKEQMNSQTPPSEKLREQAKHCKAPLEASTVITSEPIYVPPRLR